MKLKIAITGSNGFVGSNLRQLLDAEFTPISRLNSIIPYATSHVIHLGGIAHDFNHTYKEEDYFRVNTIWTQELFDQFLLSNASTFIFFSSIKALSDHAEVELTEELEPNPGSIYGKSKLLAEQYILSKLVPDNKRVIILRPSMIHGDGNKGNLNSLVRFVKSGIPWPLGKFDNKRSFCSIDNLVFILNELLRRPNIPSGIYHVADSEVVSTNEIIHLINQETKLKGQMFPLPKEFILFMAKLGDLFHLPLNSFFLDKLVSDLVVSNRRIMQYIGKPLPLTTKEGLSKSINWLVGNTPPINK